ncbi:MAG: SRPBCC family protein [Parvularculaceae bacterium]
MTIAPIVKAVSVGVSQKRAFDMFVERIGEWWPKEFSIGQQPIAQVIIEPRAGGRWFERSADGAETDWGKVLEWSPPGRLLLAWQISDAWKFDPSLITEVEMRFIARGEMQTEVILEHRNLERYGAAAKAHAKQLDGGWPGVLGAYAALAGAA